MKYGYLGPEGTFTEAALEQLLAQRGESGTAERYAAISVPDALGRLQRGELDGVVVPIENSLEGGVPATLDALTRHGELQIVAETLVTVAFVCAVRPGTALEDVRAFGTHPHAEAQVRSFLRRRLPAAEYIPTASTAAAAKALSEGTADYQAAIGPALAAERFGLDIAEADIGDNADAVTRFILVQRPGSLPERTGADKTTIVAGLRSDRSGALLELLEQFATRGITMSRLESRPTGNGLGLYQFSIDLLGHVEEERVAEALAGAYRICRELRFLGSYPSADGKITPVESLTTDTAFQAARCWLDGILEHGRRD
ncbi:prephenate dehydratase [Sediminivirga luteola]|uniref:Prephenate dehydratase n=1 Tax=Sediminivirga luteola TaxID=1774748 RepID=A0A8J2TVY0_9MICO|nr:prephenate dehydratase [Sediminivirga luteola]GGA05714.1 prephenate dehydratase [Sediminivirga luteola]